MQHASRRPLPCVPAQGRFVLGSGPRRLSLAVLFLLLLVAVLAPPPAVAARRGSPIVVVDDLHRRVVLPAPATRVVSLAPSDTEILLALGLRDRIVGVDADSLTYLPAPYAAEVRGLPNVGSAFSGLDVEAVARLKPDLILALPGTVDLAKLLALHEKVLLLEPQNMAGIYYDILAVGKATGVPERAIALVERLKAKVAAVQAAVAHLPHPTVFYEIDPSIYTVGPGSFIDQLIQLAGGRNAVAPYVHVAYPKVSSELVIRADPQVIVLGDIPFVSPKAVASRPGWSVIAAVRQHHVYANINPDLLQQPAPAVVDGLVLLAEDIHPGLRLHGR